MGHLARENIIRLVPADLDKYGQRLIRMSIIPLKAVKCCVVACACVCALARALHVCFLS